MEITICSFYLKKDPLLKLIQFRQNDNISINGQKNL